MIVSTFQDVGVVILATTRWSKWSEDHKRKRESVRVCVAIFFKGTIIKACPRTSKRVNPGRLFWTLRVSDLSSGSTLRVHECHNTHSRFNPGWK